MIEETKGAAVEGPLGVIKKYVEEQIMPPLMEERESAIASIKNHLENIKKCNADSTDKQTNIKNGVETTTATGRSTHATCREEEKEKESTKNGACQALDTFLSGVNTPETRPTGRDAMVKYVETMSGYFCPKGPEATDKDAACKKAEKEHESTKRIATRSNTPSRPISAFG